MNRQLLKIILILICALSLGDSVAIGATPVVPDASPEARALLNFVHAMYGKKTLSGQMWAPWGIDEIKTVHDITGKFPAIRGQDYIHERANKRENELAIEWWKAGGIPTIMWHWGAPSRGEGYNQSKMAIDIDRCFQPGTEEHTAMWSDLKRIADHLTELRDANVPVLWRPMHECDGDWFWYGKGGGERFVRLWRTMFDYFTKERKLNNLIWVLCHTGRPKADWNPGKAYYDLAGPDNYGKGIQAGIFNATKAIHGDTTPIPYHECGTIPDPDESFQNQITWSWWMLWHTQHLTNHNREALIRAYNHDLILTRDELPNIMDYLTDAGRAPAMPATGPALHPFLYAGEWDTRKPEEQSIFIVREGKIAWQYTMPLRTRTGAIQEFDDATLLSNGNIIFSKMSGAGMVSPDKKIIWEYPAPEGTEVHSCQCIGKDRVLIMRNGNPAQAMIINTATNAIEKEIPIPTTVTGTHGQFRHIRMTRAGTLLVPHLGENKVVEYDMEGKALWSVPAKSPWHAVRLKNGNTLIAGDWNRYAREVNPKGETVWEFTQADVPNTVLGNIQTAMRLANGNTVLCCWIAGDNDTSHWAGTVQVYEVTQDKQIV